MLEGYCPKCGIHYCGWALSNKEQQKCPKCGIDLNITEDVRPMMVMHPSSQIEKYSNKPRNNITKHNEDDNIDKKD